MKTNMQKKPCMIATSPHVNQKTKPLFLLQFSSSWMHILPNLVHNTLVLSVFPAKHLLHFHDFLVGFGRRTCASCPRILVTLVNEKNEAYVMHIFMLLAFYSRDVMFLSGTLTKTRFISTLLASKPFQNYPL